MRSKTGSLHPFLILLALAMASFLFVVACGGGGEATQIAQVPEAAEEADVAQAPEAAEEANLAEQSGLAEVVDVPDVLVEEEAEEVVEVGGPKYGGTLVFAMVADHVTLDPPIHLSTVDIAITQSLYDNLLMIQPDLSVKPELATSWEGNEDLSSYTFHLRKGVKFHHGKEFKAEDVLFTFERLLDPVLDSPARPTYSTTVEDIVAVDDYTVRFDLVGPNAFFPESLSIYQARILPADVDVSLLTTGEFGSGPFKILEHLPGERTTLVRYDDYWEQDKPYLDELVFQNIKEAATRSEALKSGDVDLIYELPPQSVPALEAHPDTVVLAAESLSNIGLDMDIRVPPYDNKLVRQAIQAATDRTTMRQAAMLGLGANAFDHPIPPNDPRFNPNCVPPDYNPELAKQLLAEAGYPEGIDLTLMTSEIGGALVEAAVAFKESAAPAGIRVDVKRRPSDGYWDVVWMVDPFTMVYWYGRANPDQALSIQYHSESSWNAPRYFNDKLDELILLARTQDLEGQIETYGEIQCILVDDVPRIVPAF